MAYLSSSIWALPTQALVKTINVAGGAFVIGKNNKGIITGIGNVKRFLVDISIK